VGANCTRFKVGDEVYSYARPGGPALEMQDEQVADNGCCAEYVAVKEWKVSSKPKTLSFEAAAGVPIAALTAWQGIFDKGGLKSGQTLLVLGAAGGVGSFAVQFAKEKGAIVIGTCSTKNVDTVKGLGADLVIDYSKGNVAEQVHAVDSAIDVVFDCVGGSSTQDGVAAVKNDGVVVSIVEFGVAELCQDARKGTGIAFMTAPSHIQLDEIRELIDAGKVKLAGLETLPLAECAKAHEMSQSGRIVGKLVLTIS